MVRLGIIGTLKGVIRRMFNNKEVEEKTGIKVAVSNAMSNAVDLWCAIYAGMAPWIGKECRSMGLGTAISSTFAMMATVEFETAVNDDVLDEDYQKVVRHIREYAEYGCAKGGLAAKPYLDSDGDIVVDIIQAECFMPTDYDGKGRITGAVFIDKHTSGKKVYTRTEIHKFENERYMVINKAFLKENVSDYTEQTDFGKEVPLSEIEEWENLAPKVIIKDIERPLFAYFKVPGANHIDDRSPLGASVYANAVDQIREADKQWSRMIWEYEAKEAAIFADISLFMPEKMGSFAGKMQSGGGYKRTLPDGGDRLYKLLNFESGQNGSSKDQIIPYGPDIRDVSLFHGLDQMLKRIEYNVGLSFGTLSDPVNVDKTATEVVSSKQRMYTTVKDIQKSLQDFLEDLIYAIAARRSLADLPVNMDYELSFNWDDSLIVDKQAEQMIRMQEVNAGILDPVQYLMWRYGVEEEEARKMMIKKVDAQETTAAIDTVMANWSKDGKNADTGTD